MAGAHPEIMKRLQETNMLHTPGYETDEFCKRARSLILEKCNLAEGEVFFLVGGTQTNMVVIDRLLGRNDGVLAVDTAHINVHEAGAIEATGHKIIDLPGIDGKLKASQIDEYIENFYADETYLHCVAPSMVYISFPTELGTVYSKKELEEISKVCKKHEIPLFIDGARLAYGLSAEMNDLTIQDIASLCDVFYIGGTKCGALFGEAVVTKRPELFPRFASLMKLHGAMLAKGRLLGLQFETLFKDGLYEKIGEYGVKLSLKLKRGMLERGVKLFIDSPTNQQFFILPNEKINELKKHISFELWGPPGLKETPVRFVTSWSTPEDAIEELFSYFDKI